MTNHVLMILDKSGSMGHLATDVRDGVNLFLDELESAFHVTISTFDTEVKNLCTNVPVGDAPRLDRENYHPDGFTALHDAFVMTIRWFEQWANVSENDRVLVFVQTDGLENSSKEHKLENVKTLIAEKEATSWTFIFSGVGPDGFEQTRGMSGRWSASSTASPGGMSKSYGALRGSTVAMAAGASPAETFDIYLVEVSKEEEDDSDAK